MCDFDDLGPLDIAAIICFVEMQLEGEQEEPKGSSPDDLLEYYDSADLDKEDDA